MREAGSVLAAHIVDLPRTNRLDHELLLLLRFLAVVSRHAPRVVAMRDRRGTPPFIPRVGKRTHVGRYDFLAFWSFSFPTVLPLRAHLRHVFSRQGPHYD
jgi:hypothetical protein